MAKYSIILSLLLLYSCERMFFADDLSDDPVSSFDVLWQSIDEHYSLFDYKNVDWDSIYQVYRPQVDYNIKDDSLFRVMSNMLYVLKDGHVNLITPFDVSRNWDWYLNRPQNFNLSVLERNYWGDSYRITGPFINLLLDSVGYIRYSDFSSNINKDQLISLLKAYQPYKGLIIDVRDNGGGYISNAELLASMFINESKVVGYTKTKNGPQKDDFSPLIPVTINPADSFCFTKPVAVLSNRSSYSSTNMFISFMSSNDQATIIGDTSGGGGGVPISTQLPNGWMVRYSSTITLDANERNIENGVPPDILVTQTLQDVAIGVDPILERAYQKLNVQQ